MEIVEHKITLEDLNKPLVIIPIGDIHIGAKGVDLAYLKKTIDWIMRTPNAYWVGMGDYAECIIHTDPRFDARSIDKKYVDRLSYIVDAQFDDLEELFTPIQDKCLGLLEGNHERQIRKRHTFDMTRRLAHGLNTPYLETSAFMRIKFDRLQFHAKYFTIFLHHGWFGGRKSGGKLNQMVDFTIHKDADAFFFGHSHDIMTKFIISEGVGNGFKIQRRKILVANTGSFVNAYGKHSTNYAEEAGMPPQKVGVVKVKIYPNNAGPLDIHVSE